MKQISRRIRKASDGIRIRLIADVDRARQYSGCQELVAPAKYRGTLALLKSAKTRANRGILRSVLVCDEQCVTVSFSKEVKQIRKILAKGAGQSQRFAREVVSCSAVGRTGGPISGGSRTDDDLNNIVKDTKKIVSQCKVCA